MPGPTSTTSEARYIAHPSAAPRGEKEWENVYNDLQHGLVAAVAQVEAEWARAPIAPHDSVYVGVSGLSMMQYHIASRLAAPKLEYLAQRISTKLGKTSGSTSSPPTSSSSAPAPTLDARRLRMEADRNLYAVVHQNRVVGGVKDAAHASFLETPVGVATLVLARCVGCLSFSRYEDDERALGALRRHWSASVALLRSVLGRVDDKDVGEDEGDGGSEVLYGRAGFLYALLYLRKVVATAKEQNVFGPLGTLDEEMRKEVEDLVSNASLKNVVDALVKRGRRGAQMYRMELGTAHESRKMPALMWRWHGKAYLGGAHGVFGILQMLITCPKPVIEEYLPDILDTVEWVVAAQDEEGNWASKAPSRDDLRRSRLRHPNDLLQWCHGAPGALILLQTVLSRESESYNYYRLPKALKSSIRASLRKGGDLVYERGLLTKGVGLCHGIAGSVYSLLAVSSALDTTDSTAYMKKAVHLAHMALLAGKLTKEGRMCVPDAPWSLYEGVAGICCAWVDVLNKLAVHPDMRAGMATGMPGYDDILV